ncbi:MFS transporter [Francisella sp. Scap27]|uniref:MFS transporter n=1 Tax=Francisella sp. Scap27 TaxID=2589986 RepID=UPI0015C06913|nr:MFS transporter [Francisella sp. Scap27]QLE78211.1 MFS transporter [Francisella sp. Scap27]
MQADIISSSKVKLTALLCYMAAMFGGASYPICALLSPQLATNFGVMTSHIVYIDTLSLLGLIIGNSLSGKIIAKIGGKNTLLLGVFIFSLSQFAIAFQDNIFLYAGFVLTTGLAMGLFVPSVSYLIVAAFTPGNKSEAKLSVLNFFFGLGGFIGPSLAGIIAKNYGWRWSFFAVFFALMILAVIVKSINLKEVIGVASTKKEKTDVKPIKSINLGVVLVGLALIAYVYIEYIITYWFSPYLQTDLNFDVETVGYIIGTFWLFVALGRFFFGEFVIPKTKDYIFIIAASLSIGVLLLMFIFLTSQWVIFVTVALLGLACASIFPVLLGFGMKQNPIVSPITMAFLVCSGSVGGAISLLSSATIGSLLPKVAAIYMGPVLCIVIIVIVLYAKRYSRKVNAES